MAVFGNFKGTTHSSFKISKGGAKIYASPGEPTVDITTGDLWIDASDTELKIYNGAAWISTTANAGGLFDVVDDTTPQLGGNLDLN